VAATATAATEATTESTSTEAAPTETAAPKPTEAAPTETAAPKPTEAAPTETATPKTVEAVHVTERQWAKVVESPDAYEGKEYIIYGQITQFDSATGTDSFRADTAHADTTQDGVFDGTNTVLTGHEDDLSDLVEGDVFRASVTVIGSYDDDGTQIGGNTSVPRLEVNILKVIG
jgi:hypothetical protein